MIFTLYNENGEVQLRADIAFLLAAQASSGKQAYLDLALTGKQSLPYLKDVVMNGKSSVARKEAVRVLASISEPEAVSILIMALEDSAFDVRWNAAIALIDHREESIVPLLKALKSNYSSFYLREGSRHVLRKLKEQIGNHHVREVFSALDGSAPCASLPWTVSKALNDMQPVLAQ